MYLEVPSTHHHMHFFSLVKLNIHSRREKKIQQQHLPCRKKVIAKVNWKWLAGLCMRVCIRLAQMDFRQKISLVQCIWERLLRQMRRVNLRNCAKWKKRLKVAIELYNQVKSNVPPRTSSKVIEGIKKSEAAAAANNPAKQRMKEATSTKLYSHREINWWKKKNCKMMVKR